MSTTWGEIRDYINPDIVPVPEDLHLRAQWPTQAQHADAEGPR